MNPTRLIIDVVYTKMSLITAASWVPRGFAAPFPTKYEFDEAEFERVAELAKLHLDDAKDDLQEAQEAEENGAREKDGDDADEDKCESPPRPL